MCECLWKKSPKSSGTQCVSPRQSTVPVAQKPALQQGATHRMKAGRVPPALTSDKPPQPILNASRLALHSAISLRHPHSFHWETAL